MLENTSVRQGLEVKVVAKENLFDDLTADEMRERLQEVSDYMDRVIDDRRVQVNMKRDDLLDDPGWNFAHDVLELIHCPELDEDAMALLDWDNWIQQTHEEITRDRATLEHNKRIMELQQKRLLMDLTRASINVSRYNEWRKKQGLDEAVTPW